MSASLSFREHDKPIDYVIIDCPPSMSLLPINALIAANESIPVQTEYYVLEGLSQLLRTIDAAKSADNPRRTKLSPDDWAKEYELECGGGSERAGVLPRADPSDGDSEVCPIGRVSLIR